MESINQLKKIESYTVDSMNDPVRLSDLAPKIFTSILSKKGIKKAIKNQLITINGKTGYSGDYIFGGETCELYQSPHVHKKPIIDLKLDVLYEDPHLAAIYKPAGIEVSGNKRYTIENSLVFNLEKSGEKDCLLRPQTAHRLDYPTSGILLVGKTTRTLVALHKMFAEKNIEKNYLAVTMGKMQASGFISTPIDQKESLTHFTCLKSIPSPKYHTFNLVRLIPKTGRRHQLRKHMLQNGSPILGDQLYFKEGLVLKGKGLYLHASCVKFEHPITKDTITINAPNPKKFVRLFPELLKD